MLLTQSDIARQNLISSSEPLRLDNATCDLTIGFIFETGPNGGEALENDYSLLPGQTVVVVSEQVFNMSDCVTGMATLVTELTRQGVLCLNAGIIDPGYRGPISATLVNFSSETKRVSKGMRLFRVLFFEHPPIIKLSEKSPSSTEMYRRDVEYFAKNIFSRDFLDVGAAMKRYWIGLGRALLRVFVAVAVPIISFFLAWITLLNDFKIFGN